MHNQQLWLTIYNLNTLLTTIGKRVLMWPRILVSCTIPTSCKKTNTSNMPHIHGSFSMVKYIHRAGDHVYPGAEIWWFMRMQFTPWNHIINVIIFLYHSIYSNSIGQHRRDPGLVQLGTWNRKHSGIHSRYPVLRFSVWNLLNHQE
jgi:hypothetical protein